MFIDSFRLLTKLICLPYFHLRQISLFVNVSQFTTLHIGFRLAVLRNPETITTAFENRQKFRRRVNFQ